MNRLMHLNKSSLLISGLVLISGFANINNDKTVWAGQSADESNVKTDLKFRDPVVKDIEGWTVHVDPTFFEKQHAELGQRALVMLANHLQRIQILIPEKALKQLQKIEIWLDFDHPKLRTMQYHPSREWLVQNGYDPRLAKKVHVTQAAQLVSREQMLKHPAVILHELAHAFHDQVLGFDQPEIINAYQQAQKAGLYQEVLLYTGIKVQHYALTNHKEYFAEATESYFYRNDFYPFVRAELKQYDPVTEALLMKIWEELP